MVRPVLVTAIGMVLVLPGCATLVHPEPAGVIHNVTEDEFSRPTGHAVVSWAFNGSDPAVFLGFWNASVAGRTAFSFRVGDGGHGEACVLPQADVGTWAILRSTQPFGQFTFHGPWKCATGVAGDANVSVDAGSWVFVAGGRDCPHLDCAFQAIIPPSRSSALVAFSSMLSDRGR